MKTKKFAVMGATGKIGQVIVEELLKRGHKVRAIGRDPKKLFELKKKGAEVCATAFDASNILSKAFHGVDAVFCMLPPAYEQDNFSEYHDKVIEAVSNAVVSAKVSHLVSLSSIGAHLSAGVGPVNGLYRFEQSLNKIKGINVVHLRPGYFMENFFWSQESIAQSSTVLSAIKKDAPLPMVASHDVATKACEFLEGLDFKGPSAFEFSGPEDLTMEQATKYLAQAYGKPIAYVQIAAEDQEKGMLNAGMKPAISKLMVELQVGVNSRKFAPTQDLTAKNRGTTKFSDFAKRFFQKKNIAA